MKTNFRTKVFNQAHELMKTTHKTFAVCLAKAWALYRLTKRMSSGVVSFCYEKADGTLRKAKGTLKEVQHLIKGTATTDSPKTVCYFDIEANAFRSFKIENLITTY